jgi:hypothetical protein
VPNGAGRRRMLAFPEGRLGSLNLTGLEDVAWQERR